MKRFRKALLALAALLGVVIGGGIWLINSALNAASDVVDSALGGAQKVQKIAQREIVGATQDAQNGAKTAPSDAAPSPNEADKPAPALTGKAPAPSLTSKTPEQTAEKTTGHASDSSPGQGQKADKGEEDSLADFAGMLSLFLGEDASDITALLKSGDKGSEPGKEATGDKPAGKNADDALTDMIPGADSPTVKNWMAGKYKGKEVQALDDALEDPKILRLIFMLGGGM